MDDLELIRQIEQGDESAFGELVDRHARYLHGVARALIGNEADAEDLVQETFAATLSGRFRGESSVRTWLVKILVRQAAMLKRRWWRKQNPLPLHEASATSPSHAAGAEAKIDLATMLQSLSEEHRTVIILRELEQMSYEEMAAVLKVPRGTVESRLHRAREQLRRNFESYL